MINVIEGMAVAVRNGLNFGGILAVPNAVTEHGVDFRALVERLFGKGAEKELFCDKLPDIEMNLKEVAHLERERKHLRPGRNYYLPAANGWATADRSVPASAYFSDSLRSLLGQHLQALPLKFAPGGRPHKAR